jgi:ribosomal protein S18 acetylase RimI-like enzyme
MPRNVTVHEASADDVTAIQHVARTTWHAAYGDVLSAPAIDEQVDEWYRDDVVADAVGSEQVVYLVASDDGDVVGFTSAGPSEQVPDDAAEEVAQLYTIYVAPDYWREGIGSRLFDLVLDRLRRRQFDALRICVLEANDHARSFYETYGFPVIEEDTTIIAGETVQEVVYAGTL